ncbi:acyl transferase/acyl hydrolase/lysophospholipase [Aspergillus desertorum]
MRFMPVALLAAAGLLSASPLVEITPEPSQTPPTRSPHSVEYHGFDAAAYLDRVSSNTSDVPTVGIAVSGGGYRAILNGAGALEALDGRTENSTAEGQLGAILQSATYLSALSGGGWLTGSVFINNFTTIDALQTSDRTWDLQTNILEGPDAKHFQLLSTAEYWSDLVAAVHSKTDAGFNTSLTDYWGRALSYTWSPIALMDNFRNGQIPLPLLVADGRNPGELVVGSNSTGLLQLNDTSIPETLKKALASILEAVGQANEDIAGYSNPFRGYQDSPAAISASSELNVVDGGEDGQNVPLHPLIQPARHVDVMFAIDSTANIHNWPNGKSLVRTYERSLNATGVGNGTVFPAVPDTNTFINLGLNRRPTFFGCDAKNLTGHAPLVAYLPNAPCTHMSNTSTFDLSYSYADRDAMVLNGYNAATRGNGTEDRQWPTCVGCAILSRSADRTRTALPDACTWCFQSYCWNGTVDTRQPHDYAPALMIKTSGARRIMPWGISVIFLALMTMMQ